MWKAVLAGTTALAIAGSSLVYAQQRMAPPERMRWQPSQEDMAAFAAARIAALKAGLVLTPEQKKNWPAFEAAFKNLAHYRIEHGLERRSEQPSANPTERLRRRAEAMSEIGALLKKLADAQGPLYDGLDQAQKRRFAILLQAIRPHHGWHRHDMWRTMQQGTPRGRGYGRRGEWRGEQGHRQWRGDGDRHWHGMRGPDDDDFDRSGDNGPGQRL